jgi:hypothetical protein
MNNCGGLLPGTGSPSRGTVTCGLVYAHPLVKITDRFHHNCSMPKDGVEPPEPNGNCFTDSPATSTVYFGVQFLSVQPSVSHLPCFMINVGIVLSLQLIRPYPTTISTLISPHSHRKINIVSIDNWCIGRRGRLFTTRTLLLILRAHTKS